MRHSPARYWTDRCQAQGHTGWQTPWVYGYDQPLRLRGVHKALSHMGIKLNGLMVLDVGCGVGGFVRSFAEKGATVTGMDISDEVIKVAKQSLDKRNENVTLIGGSIEEMDFPPASFDLVTSVTVLQHVVEEKKYEQAVRNIVEVVRPGGHILIVERAPIAVTERLPSSEMIIRPRAEWIETLKEHRCSLVYERGHPSLGISSLLRLHRLLRSLLYRVISSRPTPSGTADVSSYRSAANSSALSFAYSIFATVVLRALYPIEHWLFLAPPRKYADLTYMVFRKETGSSPYDQG